MLSKDALEVVLDSGPWLLQSPFPGGKGDGGLTSCDRLLSPERVCSANSVQDGDCNLRASLRPRGRFPSFHRSEGRVFTDTRSSVVEEAFEVPVTGDSLSVQGPVLWTVDCPSGLHSGVCNRLCVGSLPRDLSSQVPGRLAGPHLFGDGGQKECPGSALTLSLGIVINEEKSDLVPSQTANYLGMTIDTGAAGFFRPMRRSRNFCRW